LAGFRGGNPQTKGGPPPRGAPGKKGGPRRETAGKKGSPGGGSKTRGADKGAGERDPPRAKEKGEKETLVPPGGERIYLGARANKKYRGGRRREKQIKQTTGGRHSRERIWAAEPNKKKGKRAESTKAIKKEVAKKKVYYQ